MRHKVTPETRKAVENAAAMGLPHDMIGALLDISHVTLAKRYRTELKQGKAKACLQVAATLFSKATRDRDTGSAIWWEKTRTGLREPRDPLTLQTAPGAPLQFAPVSREELTQQILNELSSAKAGALPAIEHEVVKSNGHDKANGSSQ